jgi:hypothetical protein
MARHHDYLLAIRGYLRAQSAEERSQALLVIRAFKMPLERNEWRRLYGPLAPYIPSLLGEITNVRISAKGLGRASQVAQLRAALAAILNIMGVPQE